MTARHRSGDQREVVFYAEPIDLDGDSCVLTFIHDITERIRSEHKVREQQEQLRQSQKMEAVGQLAGGIAHDFNNVLTSILGLSDLILCAPDLPEAMAQDVRDIRAAAERAGTLTRQILAFSRRQALNPETTSLNELLTGLDRMLGRTLGEHIRLVTILTPDLGLVEVDVGQLEQVLLNLALNARDAMPDGGTLTLETANVELDEEMSRDYPDLRPGPHVMLAVSDTGVGMDKDTMSRIFEPFYTTKPAGKGTGLGLSTVYGVVKQSGGAITVCSVPEQGTTFRIYLPRVGRRSAAAEASSQESEPQQGSESILLVEDEHQVRSLVTRVLSALGYEVTATATGQEALDVVDTGRPFDLLLTDLILPGEFQGHQVAERVLRTRPALPVLYMSGYTRDSIVHAGRLDEGVNFLAKPFTTEALAQKVREVIEQGNPPRNGVNRGGSRRVGRA